MASFPAAQVGLFSFSPLRNAIIGARDRLILATSSFGADVEIRVKPTNYRSVRLDVDAGALSEP